MVANPGPARGEQGYGAEGLCRLAQNCLAEFWARHFTRRVSDPRANANEREGGHLCQHEVSPSVEAQQLASAGLGLADIC